ncbi:hypothetical protein BDZ97DRAFT_1928476 [Flammula alnicola]|nr:hypothetical protein BDZ97DRAFT_1928476 [Flammula alnicola]
MSSEPPISQLSQELIDKILDHVAANSSGWLGDNLLQCAFVSRSFRPRSQLYIFSSIDIRGGSETREEKVQNLLEIIQDNPEIAHYIEELSLECTDNEYSWIFEDQTFIDVMERILTSDRPLRKLTIKADTEADDGYNTLPLEDPEPLLDNFFLPFIAPFITSLLDPTSDGLNSTLELFQLKSFTVYTDELSDLGFEQKIIDLSRESLEELHFITMQTAWNGIFHGSADLQHSTRLRSLRAHVLFPEDSLVSIRRTLSSIRTRSLENLFIEAKVAFCDLSEPEVVLDADWAIFCSEVARVMSGAGSSFEFKMTYLYRDSTDMGLNEYKVLLQKRCQLVMAKLRKEKLSSLEDDPRFTLILSHALEFDALYEYTLGENAYE